MKKSSEMKTTPQKFDMKDIEIDRIDFVYNGYFKVLKYRFRHRRFEGDWSPMIERELFERGHAVAVLAYHVATDQIVLVEQIRVGAIAAQLTPWQLEIVAGVIDADETATEVALREAQEEAGLTIDELIPMTRYLSSSGGCSETIQLYLGLIDSVDVGGIHGLSDENEDILVHLVPRQTAMAWLDAGKIENAATIIALQWLALNFDTILKRDERKDETD